MAASQAIRITPPRRWPELALGDVWTHRELVLFLVWRDLKVRYKQTVLGVAWALLQPLVTVTIFSVIFGRLAGLPSENVPYPVLALSGILPWQLFSSAVSGSSNSLVGSASLLTKVYFPRLIIPIAAVAATLVDFSITVTLLAAMMVWYGVVPTAGVFVLPLVILLALMLAFSIGLWTSSLNVQYRDVQYVLPFALQMLLFLSPVAYSATLVPQGWLSVAFSLNPLSGIIQAFRWALFGTPFAPAGLVVSAAVMLALLIGGLFYFKRMEESFADVI